MKPKLSIITVNYRSSSDIRDSLQSIMQNEDEWKDFEYIIVDNNSDDLALEDLKKDFPFLSVLYAPSNGGFAYGNNVGIEASQSDYIFLLNPDTLIRKNSISKLLKRLEADPAVAVIGPKLLFTDGRNQSYFLPKSFPTLWRFICERFFLHRLFSFSKMFNSYFRTYISYDRETEVEQVSGAAFMFKRSVINDIGLLDENYFMYFEESDYCFQACKRGLKMLYYPESEIVHKGGLSAEKSWKRSTGSYIRSMKYYFKKNAPSAYYPVLAVFAAGSTLRMFFSLLRFKRKYRYFLYQLEHILFSKPSFRSDHVK